MQTPEFQDPQLHEIWSEYQKIQEFLAKTPEIQDLREEARAAMSPTPRELLYEENSVSVYRYQRETPATRPYPLFVVPSLVNKPCIMDLLEGESFIADMLSRGFDVYMIEWGIPNPGQRDLPLDHYLETYLDRAVKRAQRMSGADGVVLAGYCLGGFMALLYTALDQGKRVKGLINMVAPVRFEDHGLLSWWARPEHFNVDSIVDAHGNVPADFFSSSFPWLVPTAKLRNMRTLFKKHEDKEFMRSFLALDIWLNENVPFPGEVYRTVIKQAYQEDQMARTGGFDLKNGRVELDQIQVPVLAMGAQHDHVAPGESCTLLADLVPEGLGEGMIEPTGHLGFALGKNGTGKPTKKYWDAIDKFIAKKVEG